MSTLTWFFALVYPTICILALWLAWLVFRRRPVSGSSLFALLLMLLSLRSFYFWGEVLSWWNIGLLQSRGLHSFFTQVTVLLWFSFVLLYTKRRRMWVLCLSPLLLHAVTLLVFSLIGDPYMLLMDAQGGERSLSLLNAIIAKLIFLSALFTLLHHYISLSPHSRRQVGFVCLFVMAMLMVWVVALSFSQTFLSSPSVSIIFFFLMNCGCAWSFFFVKPSHILPVARELWVTEMPEALLVFNRRSEVVDCNRSASKLFGRDSEALMGMSMEQVRGLKPALLPRRIGLEPVKSECMMRNNEGRRCHYLLQVTTIQTEDKKPEGALMSWHDISDFKNMERALRYHSESLERMNEDLERFAFVAAHDLQEPLRKIQTFGDRLSQKYKSKLDERGQHYLSRMQLSASRMQQLIDDLLMFSRLEREKLLFQRISLHDVIEEVLDTLQVQIEHTHATVDVELLPEIEADPTQMKQLFLNLLSNALKFHRPDVPPEVKVRCVSVRGGRLQIEVRDNGIGFEPRHKRRIFEVFQRLHSRESYEGTGIGLAICHRIVEAHTGSIEAISEPDQGAMLRVILPVRQPRDSQPDMMKISGDLNDYMAQIKIPGDRNTMKFPEK